MAEAEEDGGGRRDARASPPPFPSAFAMVPVLIQRTLAGHNVPLCREPQKYIPSTIRDPG